VYLLAPAAYGLDRKSPTIRLYCSFQRYADTKKGKPPVYFKNYYHLAAKLLPEKKDKYQKEAILVLKI